MEDVLDVYQRPYDPLRPVVCFDESNKQMVGDYKEPLPPAPGQPAKIDYGYERKGVANIFMQVEPLAGKRFVDVTEQRCIPDFAEQIRRLVDERYPMAEKVVLVMDNLNTHCVGSLYDTFDPETAHRLADRLEIHYTPKHGSWLNIAEIELSVLGKQCLAQRIPDIKTLAHEVQHWQRQRNASQGRVDWQFTTDDARIRLKRLYPIEASAVERRVSNG